jgi:hypothetical protein
MTSLTHHRKWTSLTRTEPPFFPARKARFFQSDPICALPGFSSRSGWTSLTRTGVDLFGRALTQAPVDNTEVPFDGEIRILREVAILTLTRVHASLRRYTFLKTREERAKKQREHQHRLGTSSVSRAAIGVFWPLKTQQCGRHRRHSVLRLGTFLNETEKSTFATPHLSRNPSSSDPGSSDSRQRSY